MHRRSIPLIVVLFFAGVTTFAQGRVRAAEGIGCDRNDLTMHAGIVTKYTRTKTHVKVTIRTDDATTETVSGPIAKMRLEGAPFLPAHFAHIESRAGVLRPRARVTAWVCTSGAVVLDWAKPAAAPHR